MVQSSTRGDLRSAWAGISFRKLGLSAAGPDWRERWRDLRTGIEQPLAGRPGVDRRHLPDWQHAGSPDPNSLIDTAIEIDECRGLLIDTWDKSQRTIIDRLGSDRSNEFERLAGSSHWPVHSMWTPSYDLGH